MQEPSISADAILEIPSSELQHFFDDMILTYNALNELLDNQGISQRSSPCRAQHTGLPGREGREITPREAPSFSMPTSGSKSAT